jgi:tRNA dimethylallyltransferase
VNVNADSAQVYRGIPVQSAAPTADELKRAEHRLYGFLDATEPSSAAAWAQAARREVADIQASGRLPILVGGTGLYIRTLLYGIAPVPAIDPDVRRQVREASVEANRARLGELDPEAVDRLKPNDTARIARALEVMLSTGKPLTHWHLQREGGIAEHVELRPLVLLPPRDWLYARCNERFALMIDSGAVEEVESLLASDFDPDLPIMRAIGVPEIIAYLNGELAREETIAAGQEATRRYAKRQYTWFAHQPPPEWPRFTEQLNERVMPGALELLGSSA